MPEQLRKWIDPQSVQKIVQVIWGGSLIKLGSAVALFGAAALTSIVQYVAEALFEHAGYSIHIPDTPPWIGLTLVVLGIGAAALGAYWQRPPPPPGPNPHDVALLRKFRETVSNNDLDFLRDHDFGHVFNFDGLRGTSAMAHWQGPRYEFVDERVEKTFAVVKSSSQKMCDLVALKTWPHHHLPNHQTALPDHHDEWNPSPNTQQSIKELNQTANKLVTSINDFERTAKLWIPIEP